MSGNYVVPGANPDQPGVESVTAGANISLTGTATNPIINSEVKMVSTNARLVTTIPSIATDIASFGINIPTASDLFVTASFCVSVTNMPQNSTSNLSAGIFINGVSISGTWTGAVHGHQGGGATSVNTMSFSATKQPQPAGNYTITLKVSASVTTPAVNLTQVNLTAIGQLQ
jgi:hypothetical protein